MVYPGYTFGGKPQQITSSFAVNRQGHVTVTGKVCQGLSKVVNQRMGAFPVATNQKVGSSNLSGRATFQCFVYVLRSPSTGRHYVRSTHPRPSCSRDSARI